MSRPSRTWLFEGEQRTLAQIRRMVPVVSETRVYRGLQAGETTRVEMLTSDTRRGQKKSKPQILKGRGRIGTPRKVEPNFSRWNPGPLDRLCRRFNEPSEDIHETLEGMK